MLTKVLEKYENDIVDPKGLKRMSLLSQYLDEKKRSLNPDDFWTMSDDVDKLEQLYNHYLGFVPKYLLTFAE